MCDNVYYGKHVYCTEYGSTIAGHIDDDVYYVPTAFQNNTYVPGANASLPAIGNSTASDTYPSALVNDFDPSELGTKVREYKYNDLSLTVYSNASITSTINGDGSHGGFIGMPNRGDNTDTYTINIEGCAFTGSFTGTNTSSWGGFVGWKANGYTVNVTNSIFALSSSLSSINTNSCSNFVRSSTGTVNIANSYYVLGFNADQGKQAYTLSFTTQPSGSGTVSFVGDNTSYDVSGITAYPVGLKHHNVFYAGSLEVVSIEATPNSGFAFKKWGDNSTDNPHDYTMTPNNTVFKAIFSMSIATVSEWEAFCEAVNTGDDFEGETVNLANDIGPVSAMAGTSEHPFSGTFDGKDHTLTFTRTATDANFTAPFRYIDGATIQNLKVDGTITTAYQFCAGLAGDCSGSNEFLNCVSDVTINSSVDGDGTHGGFASRIQGEISIIMFKGCAFTGQLLGNTTHSWGGFVGWTEFGNNGSYAMAVFFDCVFAPSTVDILSDNSKTFSRGDTDGINVVNGFYDAEKNLGTDQGLAMQYTIDGGTDVSVALAGQTVYYTLSDITGYWVVSDAAGALQYGSTLYANSGATVSLNLEYTGTSIENAGFVANHGTLTGDGNPYSLVMETNSTVITAMERGDAPTALAVANITPHTAVVSWQDDAASYNLRYNKMVPNNIAALSWSDYQENYKVRYRTAEVSAYSFYEDFEDESSLTDWTTVDLDGDRYCWGLSEDSGYNNSQCIVSLSVYGPLDPDDWLITPKITLQGTMEVWMANYLNTSPDSFAIYLTTDDLSSFSTGQDTVQSFLDGTTLVAKTTLEGNEYHLRVAGAGPRLRRRRQHHRMERNRQFQHA